MRLSQQSQQASTYVTLYSSDSEVVAVEVGKLVAKGNGIAEISGILLPPGETICPVTVKVGSENPFIDVGKKKCMQRKFDSTIMAEPDYSVKLP